MRERIEHALRHASFRNGMGQQRERHRNDQNARHHDRVFHRSLT